MRIQNPTGKEEILKEKQTTKGKASRSAFYKLILSNLGKPMEFEKYSFDCVWRRFIRQKLSRGSGVAVIRI